MIYLTSRIKGRYVFLDVRDEGIGIMSSDIPHLFQRFYRADNARTSALQGTSSGYGLGLAIVKQIIASQQGDVLVSSTHGKGSTFTLKLHSK